jgi:hypothetical protein
MFQWHTPSLWAGRHASGQEDREVMKRTTIASVAGTAALILAVSSWAPALATADTSASGDHNAVPAVVVDPSFSFTPPPTPTPTPRPPTPVPTKKPTPADGRADAHADADSHADPEPTAVPTPEPTPTPTAAPTPPRSNGYTGPNGGRKPRGRGRPVERVEHAATAGSGRVSPDSDSSSAASGSGCSEGRTRRAASRSSAVVGPVEKRLPLAPPAVRIAGQAVLLSWATWRVMASIAGSGERRRGSAGPCSSGSTTEPAARILRRSSLLSASREAAHAFTPK